MVANYADVADLKQQVPKRSSNDDGGLEFLLKTASRWIDRVTNTPPGGFVQSDTASAFLFSGSGGNIQWISEAMQITLVEVKQSVTDAAYESWDATDWIAASGDPRMPNFNRLPYQFILCASTGDQTHFTSGKWTTTRGFRPDVDDERGMGQPTVRVTAKWGYDTAIPDGIKQITIIQASRWHKRAQSAWSDAVASNNFEMMLYQKDLDPDVSSMLLRGRWIRPSIGGRGQ